MVKIVAYLDCGCAIYENGERAVCPTCAAGQTRMNARTVPITCGPQHGESASNTVSAVIPAPTRFGIAELTYIVGEAICEFEGAGPDSISDEEVHKFLARVLDELQSAGVVEVKRRLLARQTVGEAYGKESNAD